MTESIQAYPLQWPIGWKRTPSHQRTAAAFRGTASRMVGPEGAQRWESAKRVTLSQGVDRVRSELRRFGVRESTVVISTDLSLRQDGLPYSQQATSKLDPGVAVYWMDGKRRRCMAIDRYNRIEDNMAAIAATLDGMRAIERHGGAEILERAFTSFVALAAPEQWFQVLNVSATAGRQTITDAHRRLAMQHHPDRPGGSAQEMARINTARDEGLAQASA